MCVHIHPIMLKLHPVFFKSPFSNQAVLRFLSEWWSHSGRSHDSWLTRPSYLRPALSELRAVRHCVDWCRGKQCLRLSVRGVLLLDIIMNIAVIIYSQHLSRWRRRGLTLLSFWRECAAPDLPKCIYVQANHSWSSFPFRRWVGNKGFLWIFANRLS